MYDPHYDTTGQQSIRLDNCFGLVAPLQQPAIDNKKQSASLEEALLSDSNDVLFVQDGRDWLSG